MSDEPKQLPPPPKHSVELTEAEKKIVPRKGRTAKEAQRALKKFKAKFMVASEWSGGIEFGAFIRERGTVDAAVAIQVYAADAMKKGIERCNKLVDQVENEELKVRLEENAQKYAESLAKAGQGLARAETDEPKQTVKQPTVNVFPANTQVNVTTVAPTPDKVIES